MLREVSLAPWWVSTWPTPTAFAGTGLVKLMAIGVSTTAQYLVPVAFLISSVVSVFRRRKRAGLLAGVAVSDSITALNDMSWHEFEMLVGEAFRVQGYGVVETASGADGGVDLVLANGPDTYFVQCKQWRDRPVGVKTVRELYGAVAAQHATGGFVVTSGRFTAPAVEFAKVPNLTLIDGRQLHAMIQMVHRAGPASQRAV